MQENTKKVIEYLNNGTQFNANEVALLMNIYMYTSMILCFNRVHIKSNELEFPSLMGVYFAPSGAYKDRPLSLLENATNEVLEFQEKQKKEIYRKIVIKNESFAESFDSKKQKNDFLKENKPRYFKDKMTGGTYQGLQTERLACLKMGIGHIHFSHGEFLDAITSPSAKTSDILMKIKEIDYSGKSSSDSIKSEETEDVVGVPLTFMVHGSVDHIYSNDNIKQKLLNVLDGGYERRCFINFSKNTKRDDSLTFMQAEKMRKYCENNMQEISNIFMNIQKNIVQSIYGDKKLEIKIPIDCREQLHEYQMFCSSLANKTKSKHKRTELNDRAMRARVLSVCIAMLEHPNDPIVNLSDIGDAITFADRCGDNFTKFIDYNGDSITEILFDKILKKPRTKTQIRNIINKNGDSYRLRMKGLQIYEKELEEFCIDNDMVLSKETQERGKTIYSIEKLQEKKEINLNELESIEIKPVDVGVKKFFSDFIIDDKLIQIGNVNYPNYLYNEDTIEEYIEKTKNKNVYFLAGVNKEKNLKRGKDNDIQFKNYVYFDFDVRKERESITDEDIKKTGLLWAERLKDDEDLKNWSYIVFSGNGIHIYYLDDLIQADKNHYKLGYIHFAERIKKLAKTNKYDSQCQNVARVGRVPFTYNNKKEQKKVEIIAYQEKNSGLVKKILAFGSTEAIRQEIIEKEMEAIREANKDNRRFIGDEEVERINKIPIEEEVLKDFPEWKFRNNKNFIGTNGEKAGSFVNTEKNILIIGESRWFTQIKQKGVGTFMYRREFSGLTNKQTFEYFNQ